MDLHDWKKGIVWDWKDIALAKKNPVQNGTAKKYISFIKHQIEHPDNT